MDNYFIIALFSKYLLKTSKEGLSFVFFQLIFFCSMVWFSH